MNITHSLHKRKILLVSVTACVLLCAVFSILLFYIRQGHPTRYGCMEIRSRLLLSIHRSFPDPVGAQWDEWYYIKVDNDECRRLITKYGFKSDLMASPYGSMTFNVKPGALEGLTIEENLDLLKQHEKRLRSDGRLLLESALGDTSIFPKEYRSIKHPGRALFWSCSNGSLYTYAVLDPVSSELWLLIM